MNYSYELAYAIYRDTLNRCYAHPSDLPPELKRAAALRAIEDAEIFAKAQDEVADRSLLGSDCAGYVAFGDGDNCVKCGRSRGAHP